jgi:hypothetical protein
VRWHGDNDVANPIERLGHRLGQPKRLGKRNAGQVGRVDAPTSHLGQQLSIAPPQRDVVTHATQMNRQCRAPAPGTEHGRAV